MRVYTTRFEFDPDCGLEPVAQAVRDWLAKDEHFGPLLAGADFLDRWHGNAGPQGAKHIVVDSVETGEELVWACKFTYPDANPDSKLQWTTQIGALLGNERAACSVISDAETPAHPASMQPQAPSLPDVVLPLLAALRGHLCDGVSADPKILTSRDVPGFIEQLSAAGRKLPIVLVSTSLQSERPLVDSAKLASLLASVAHVYQYVNKFTGLKFSEEVGKQWSAWDGAVRVYWPMQQDNKAPYMHRLWMRWQIEGLRRAGNPEEAIFRYVCRSAGMIPAQLLTTWEDVGRRRTRLKIAELTKKAGEHQALREMIQLYEGALADKETESKALQTSVQEARHDSRRLHEELERTRTENHRLRENLKVIYRSQGKPVPDGVLESTSEILEACRNVGDLVDWYSTDDYKDRIHFIAAARKDARDSLFQDIEQCAEAFRILATVYWKMKKDRSASKDDFLKALEPHHIKFEPHVSEVTAGRYGREYERMYKGMRVDMGEHLKLGASFDPRHTMRIHFQWDAEENLVVVSYCGYHPKTGN